MANPAPKKKQTPPKKTLSDLRMKAKPALAIIGVLFLGNIIWFVAWLFALGDDDKSSVNNEVVATVAGEDITRQQWLTAMEQRYGKEVLQTLVSERVMLEAAKANDITVSDEEIETELALMRTVQDGTDTTIQSLSKDELKEYIRTQLILEKVLTHDVIVNDEDIQNYYDENKAMYDVPTAYRTSIIVSETKEAAQAVVKELKDGSEFGALARERSLDRLSASLDGDLGYVTGNVEEQDPAIIKAAKKVEENEVSDVFELQDGTFAVIQVNEIQEGHTFKLADVKENIQRTLALEQLPMSVYPETFWDEFDATWFYGDVK